MKAKMKSVISKKRILSLTRRILKVRKAISKIPRRENMMKMKKIV